VEPFERSSSLVCNEILRFVPLFGGMVVGECQCNYQIISDSQFVEGNADAGEVLFTEEVAKIDVEMKKT
jgi:hypothetical protein